MDAKTDVDTFASLEAQFIASSGASLAELNASVHRAELEETASTWALLEARGCRAPHAFPRCSDSCVVSEEGWIGEPAGCPEGDAAAVGLHLAAALEALGRRRAAIAALSRAAARDPSSDRVRLARAKLLFRAGDKALAGEVLEPLLNATRHAAHMPYNAALRGTDSDIVIDSRTAGDAFYIAGWVRIHADDHTTAYKIWLEGAALLPHDPRLARQARKVATWGFGTEQSLTKAGQVLAGACSDSYDEGVLTRLAAEAPPAPAMSGCERVVLEGLAAAREPALRLFAPSTQCGTIAVKSRTPLLPPSECSAVLGAVDAHIKTALAGVWGTVRRSTVPTTDIAVEDVPALVPWLRSTLAARIFPWVAAAFPRLSDGSDLGPHGSRLRVHDAFIVRYDAEFGSRLLPGHCDTSVVSVTVALNQRGRDFEEGGLWLQAAQRAVEPDEGCAVAFAGPLRHGGWPVSTGVRMILVLFLYVEDFAYGHLLQDAKLRQKGVSADISDAQDEHRPGSVGSGVPDPTITILESASCTAESRVAADVSQPSDVTSDARTIQPVMRRELDGFVVYRETAQLMEALESSDLSGA